VLKPKYSRWADLSGVGYSIGQSTEYRPVKTGLTEIRVIDNLEAVFWR
jgi:hypothetical protein